MLKHPSLSLEESKSSITYVDPSSPGSPMAFFDETNRKVLIISEQKENDRGSSMNASGHKIQHCIEWEEDTDPKVIEKAIEDVLEKVKQGSNSK